MASNDTTRLDRFKLGATFNGHVVTHRTFQPDLPLQQRTEITTVWHSERELGIGGLGVVWLQKQEGTAELRAVKIISKAHLQPQEIGALMEFQDVCSIRPFGYSLAHAHVASGSFRPVFGLVRRYAYYPYCDGVCPVRRFRTVHHATLGGGQDGGEMDHRADLGGAWGLARARHLPS